MISTTIDNRLALPIRAIPAATNSFLSVKDVIAFLIDPEAYYPTGFHSPDQGAVPLPLAHRILQSGETCSMLPAEHICWTAKTGDEPDSISSLPADIFVWADEMQSFYKEIRAEILADQSCRHTRDAPAGTGVWNLAPYLLPEDRQLVEDSITQIQSLSHVDDARDHQPKRLKQYGRDENGVDAGLQSLAESVAESWRAEGKCGNQLSKRKIAKAIATDRILKVITVERVIRQTWKK